MKIFISTTSFAGPSKEPLRLLKEEGIDCESNPYKRKLTETEISGILESSSYEGLIAGTEPLTKKVLENAKSLKVISRLGAGLDNVDLDAAGKLNIKVYNTPDVLIDSAAELTIGLILSCLRRLVSMDRNMRKKIWKKEMGSLFKGKTLGIIGFGRIGKRVAQLTDVFGTKIIFYDVRTIETKAFKQVPLDKLLKESDIISIHSSAKEELISKKEISKMRKGVILVNTSRGPAINEESLYQGLSSGKIAYAALDVHSSEPYSGKLTDLGNVILTPHIGSYAKEARIEMEMEAVRNLLEGLKG